MICLRRKIPSTHARISLANHTSTFFTTVLVDTHFIRECICQTEKGEIGISLRSYRLSTPEFVNAPSAWPNVPY